MFPSLFVVMLGLCFCGKESFQSSLGRPRLSGPSEALVKQIAEFYCDLQIYPQNEPILLQLFKAGDRDKVLAEYISLDGEVGVFPMIIKPDHDGNLECVAKAQNNSNIEPTVSSMHYLKVVEPVKGAEIILPSGQEEFFEGTTIELECKVRAGNDVTYKWLLNGRLIPDSHLYNESLLIHRATSKDSGSYVCMAINEFNKTQTFTSNSTDVEITVKVQSSLGRPRLSGPSEALVKQVAVFYCDLQIYPQNESILLQLFKAGDRDKVLAEYISLDGEVGVFLMIIRPYHDGNLECVAKVHSNSNIEPTVSSMHYLKVVEPVKGAEIILPSGQEEFFEGTTIELECKVAAGNDVTYKWLLNGRLIPDSHLYNESLLIHRATSKDSGSYVCMAINEFNKTQTFTSNSTDVEITVKVQSSLGRPRLSGPSEALVKQVAVFYCDLQIYPQNESILLQLFKAGDRDKVLAEYISLDGEVGVFLMIIRPYHDGNLECVAKVHSNSNIEPTVSSMHYLKVVEPVKGAEIILPSGQEEFFEGTTIELECKVRAGNDVTYKWLLNGRLIPDSHLYNESLLIHRATSKDSGSYVCMAINEFNKTQTFTSNSTDVEITVKVQSSLGRPRLSGPSEALVKQVAVFYCDLQIYPQNESILLQLFKAGDRDKVLAEYTSLNGEEGVFPMIIKPDHDGNLECVAKAQNNSNIEPTVSSMHYLKVVGI